MAKLKRFRLAAVASAQRLYGATLKKTPFGPRLARALQRRGLFSAQEVRLAKLSSTSLPYAREDPGQDVYPPLENLFSPFVPLKLRVDPALSLAPRLNVLLPSLRVKEASGGPNTALILAARLAARGVAIRLVATDTSLDKDVHPLIEHVSRISGERDLGPAVEVADGSNREKALAIGPGDLFMATAWWTAQMAKYAVRLTRHDRFVYLIQDFEPLLHAASSTYALALETYGLPHIPVINTKLLRDYLDETHVGLYADKMFAASALHFEPAIDRARFFFPESQGLMSPPRRRRRLLFYARPTAGLRNLFEMGIVALKQLAREGRIPGDRWDVWAMGETMRDVALTETVVLRPQPWHGFDEYARMVRESDVLLSLMLSPHPSYPPLEMAASGKLVVTNSYSVKTAERLQAISPNILVAAPTIEALTDALREAVTRAEAASFERTADFGLPRDWNESFGPIVPKLVEKIEAMQRRPVRPARNIAARSVYPGDGDYERYATERLERRRSRPRGRQQPGLVSFITTAWNTPAPFLEALAASLFTQDGGTDFEWVILDNGSTEPGTLAALERIARHPCVDLFRVEENVGIVPGMRRCLERARGRYVLPLDSDDLLVPDCVVTLTEAIVAAGSPEVLYSDEDKVEGDRYSWPYFKPDWDPVLFVNSCYIAHLCAFDRVRALELGVYSDRGAEGCHDWDTYLRFLLAGRVPVHVPEVLYSWRVHQASTSLNIDAKGWVYDSHRHVLQRFLNAQANPGRFELVASPLFDGKPDWWMRRRRVDPKPIASVCFGTTGDAAASSVPGLPDGADSVALSWDDSPEALAKALAGLDPKIGLVHLRAQAAKIEDDEWYWEGLGLLELFPDAVVVGGLIHDGAAVVADGYVFGFEDSVIAPHRGRPLADPGYFAQLRKQRSVSAVSAGHCLVDRRFLEEVLRGLSDSGARLRSLALWLGAHARRADRRVIFTPFFRALLGAAPEEAVSIAERAEFRTAFRDLLPDARCYSPRLGLDRASAYAFVQEEERAISTERFEAIAPPYAEWLAAELAARQQRYDGPAPGVRFSLLTTVYPGSRPDLLVELARSISGQTLAAFEWIVVVHGPVADALLDVVARLATDPRVRVVRHEAPLCITAALRIALEQAGGDYIVPVDSDDLLTTDALWVLGTHAVRRDSPELLFSDEDLLIGGEPASPFLRPEFDPVLHLETSWIWHLCAIRMDAARASRLYSDDGATWCHDWDTIFRIHDAGGRIEHVPEILYHWRQHQASTSNRAGGSDRSQESVRHVLERRRAMLSAPDRFEVRAFPIDRGAPEAYLARRSVDAPLMLLLHGEGSVVRAAPECRVQTALAVTHDANLTIARIKAAIDAGTTYLGFVAGEIVVDLAPCYWEVVRLFELHPSLGCVSGRLVGPAGAVCDACWVRDGARLVSPMIGLASTDAGAYAFALKPHLVDAPCGRIAFFRVAALGGRLPDLREADTTEVIIAGLMDALSGAHDAIAYSPLVLGACAASVDAVSTRPKRVPIARGDNAPRGPARFEASKGGFR